MPFTFERLPQGWNFQPVEHVRCIDKLCMITVAAAILSCISIMPQTHVCRMQDGLHKHIMMSKAVHALFWHVEHL
jgi:hypothetical protein